MGKVKTKKSGEGANGIYYRLNRHRGLKTLSVGDEFFKTKTSALRSYEAKMLRYELKNQKRAYKRLPDLICKPFQIKTIKTKKGWLIGIEMEHLGNTRLGDKPFSEEKCMDIIQDLRYEMESVGIEHEDLHENNVMFSKGKYKVIDFDPDFVTIK